MNHSFIEQLMVYRSCKTVFQMPLKYWTTLLYPMKSPLPRPQPIITRLMGGAGMKEDISPMSFTVSMTRQSYHYEEMKIHRLFKK